MLAGEAVVAIWNGLAAGARDVVRGCYRLEYIRGKTAWS